MHLAPRPPLFPYTTLFRSYTLPSSSLSGGVMHMMIMIATGAPPEHIHTTARYRSCPRCDTCHNSSHRGSLPHTRSMLPWGRSEEHTSELQSHSDLVCRLLL